MVLGGQESDGIKCEGSPMSDRGGGGSSSGRSGGEWGGSVGGKGDGH